MPPSPPRISLVTPSFNQAQFLEQTLRSVLDQAYPELEYVVIDGGSTDGSQAIIERYRSQLAYAVSEPDRGHAHAINKGFSRTSGEIMAWLNSDDLYLPWTLSTVAEIFATHPEVEWINGFDAFWDDRGRMTGARENLKNKYDFLLGRYAWIQQESTFWRRSLWEAAGGQIDESYRLMVDGELWTRFFQRAELHHVGCVLGGFRSWGQNRSATQMDACHAEMQRAIGAMRQHCDPKTLRTAALLQGAARIANRLPMRSKRRFSRRFLSNVLDEAGYRRLRYDGSGFSIETVPFAL